MTKTTNLNHFLGGAGWLGAGFGGWLGVKLFSGVWCVPCISPMTVLLIPIIGCVAGTNGCVGTCCVSVISLAGAVLGAAFVAGIKGCVGVCAVRVMRSAGAALGFDTGVFFGGFI